MKTVVAFFEARNELTSCGVDFVLVRVVLKLLTKDAHEIFTIENSNKDDES